LTLDEAGRLPQARQAVRDDIHRVQIRQRRHERGADPTAGGWIGDGGGFLGADDDAAPAFHRVEHRPDDAGVFAEQVRSWRQRKHPMHGREPAELARHVVRRRRHRAERRTADDDLGVAEANEVGEVRVAAGELRDLGLARHIESGNAGSGQALAQPLGEARPIELFAGAYRARVGVHAEKVSCAPCISTTPDRRRSCSSG
jgi:hypothetical protein